VPQDPGLDLPLDAVLGGHRAIDGHRAHAARAGAVRDQPGVEGAGLAGGEAEQQVELALRRADR
jgi:hypothetical protein